MGARRETRLNLKLYNELAAWWPLMSAPDEYEEESSIYRRVLLDTSRDQCRSLLELGSGGGNNASYLKKRFDMVLVDLSPGMLAVSRALNPECEHVQGDMRTVRLGREFDGVFVHDAVMYMTTEDDLRRAIETASIHCKAGGVALFAPDHVRENFYSSTGHGGSDDGARGFRYLEWSWDPDPSDTTYVVDYAYLIRESDGTVTHERDHHVEGLFSRTVWLQLLNDAGFTPTVVPLEHSDLEDHDYEMFSCVKR